MLTKEERHALATRVRLGESNHINYTGINCAVASYPDTYNDLYGLWVLGVKVCEYTITSQDRVVDGVGYSIYSADDRKITLQEFALAYLEREE